MTDEDIKIFNNYLINEVLKKIDPTFTKYSENIKVIRFNNEVTEPSMSLIDIKLLKQVIYDYCLERIDGSSYGKHGKHEKHNNTN
jgi:hypothetical protein